MAKKTKSPLQPLIDLVAKNRGMKSTVLLRVIQKGRLANWGQVSCWLHPDPAKRRIPRDATIETLMEIQREMMKEMKG